jgi:TnpA family transposase
LPLVRQHWGAGYVASADGLRFRVPVAAPNALPNRKYFGSGKGVTYVSFTSDPFTGLHGIVIPGTIRDSLYLLEARLRMTPTLQPAEIMTDMASASDVVFALFWFQGYAFRPRFVDLSDKRFWRFDPTSDDGPWNPLSRHRLSRERILKGYDAVLRLSASLREGTVSAQAVMRMLGGSGRGLTALGRAAVEIGRTIKTRHMLRLATDEYYARRIHAQLNRGEQRNRLAREVFFGRRGALYRSYVAGQENQLGALGFVLNAIVLWNTIYLNAALEQVRATGQVLAEADVAHLTPLGYEHIRIEGRYRFALTPGLARGQLRHLRTPRPDVVSTATA